MKSTAEEQKEKGRAAYAEIARTRSTEGAATCCAPPEAGPDYSADEIGSVPAGAYLGEGSGNPVRAAQLQPGETAIHRGSAAVMHVFPAPTRGGPPGRVVGIDMTPEMLARARANAARGSYPQVEF